MMRPALSRAATALLRQILSRTDLAREKVLIGDFRSTDWHSLTFAGERHEISLRVCGAAARRDAATLVAGLEDAEFTLPGHIVAEIAVTDGPDQQPDGSVELKIEALTLVDA